MFPLSSGRAETSSVTVPDWAVHEFEVVAALNLSYVELAKVVVVVDTYGLLEIQGQKFSR